MKKEFSTLIQFIIITGLVAAFSCLMLPIQYPEISVEAMNYAISEIRYWIYSFIGLSAIRFCIFSVISRKAFVDTNKSQLKLLLDEISKTGQYFIIAVISVFGAFWFFLGSISSPGMSFDLLTIWYGIHQASLEWLIAFSVLSLFRLGIVLIWNYIFQEKQSVGTKQR